LHIITC